MKKSIKAWGVIKKNLNFVYINNNWDENKSMAIYKTKKASGEDEYNLWSMQGFSLVPVTITFEVPNKSKGK